MSGAYISIVLILSVIFIILLLGGLAKKQSSYIYTHSCGNADSIEAEIREMLRKNPDSEIVVVTYGDVSETEEILEKLKNDFPQLHIIKNNYFPKKY